MGKSHGISSSHVSDRHTEAARHHTGHRRRLDRGVHAMHSNSHNGYVTDTNDLAFIAYGHSGPIASDDTLARTINAKEEICPYV